ncbi:MAG: hypothetical protein FWE18_00885 [Alphaproteobacteria bacterium]|nr:hypothetical protein [Alphaproteobacteria bacterium]
MCIAFIAINSAKAEFYISAGVGQAVKYNNKAELPSPPKNSLESPVLEPSEPIIIDNKYTEFHGTYNDAPVIYSEIKETISQQTIYNLILRSSVESVDITNTHKIQSSFLGSIGYRLKNFRFEFEGKNVKSRQNMAIDSHYYNGYDIYSAVNTIHHYEEWCDKGTWMGDFGYYTCPQRVNQGVYKCLDLGMLDGNKYECETIIKGQSNYNSSISQTQDYHFKEIVLNNTILGFFNVLYDIPIIPSYKILPAISIFGGGGVGYALSKYSSSGEHNESFSSLAYQGKAGAYLSIKNVDFIAAVSRVYFNKEPLKNNTLQQVELSLRYNFKSSSSYSQKKAVKVNPSATLTTPTAPVKKTNSRLFNRH